MSEITAGQPSWLDVGPAEFDRKRMPRGADVAKPGQPALFFAAHEPKPARAAQLPAELPGQADIFDVLSESEA